jgi:hypothetical protein
MHLVIACGEMEFLQGRIGIRAKPSSNSCKDELSGNLA